MSNHVSTPSSAAPQHASTSTNPAALTPASYHPGPRPTPTTPTNTPAPLPFNRIDTHHIKQQLHDALGEAGLPYWKALNGYLLGQVGRHELEALVRGWLKGKNLQLHNQLLTSLLHNASSPQIAHVPPPLNLHKRRKGGMNAPDFDSDPAFIEPLQRVQYWVMGMGGKERDRVRRAVEQGGEEGTDGAAAHVDMEIINGRKRKWTMYSSNATHPPLAQSSRSIPSANQLGARMTQVAKSCGLDVAPEAQSEVGEFMGVGLNQHLADMFHSVKHMTGRDRPGSETVRVPLGIKQSNVNGVAEHPVPSPTLQTMQYLFTLQPGLHPQASPTLYKLESGFTQAEVENASPPTGRRGSRSKASHPLSISTPAQPEVGGPPPALTGTGMPSRPPASPTKTGGLQPAGGQSKMDTVAQKLVETGLVKIDKAGHDEGGERKREKKHNLHWKYEDPALILKDLLG